MRTMNREEMIWFFFSYKTVVITLNESYLALSRNRWKIRATPNTKEDKTGQKGCRNDRQKINNPIKRK